MSTRDAYIQKMKLQLDELAIAMDEVEAKAHQSKNEIHEKYLAEMRTLREQSQLALDRLNELKTSGEDSWKNVLANTEKVRDAFVTSFEHFKSKL